MATDMDGNPAQRKKDFFSNSTSIVGVRYGKFSDHCLQNAGDEEKQEIKPYVEDLNQVLHMHLLINISTL